MYYYAGTNSLQETNTSYADTFSTILLARIELTTLVNVWIDFGSMYSANTKTGLRIHSAVRMSSFLRLYSIGHTK